MVNFGIIGAGNIARKFAKATTLCDDVALYGIASRDIEKAKKFADEYGAKMSFGSYEDMLNCKEIDAIYVAVPHNFHANVVKMCFEHNKPVLCEKPMFTNFDEAQEVISIAKEKNLLLMEAMWTRFLPTTLKVKQWLKDGKIGELKLIDTSFSFFSNVNPNGRLYNKDLAGGCIYDVGSYCILYSMDMANSPLKDANGVMSIGSTDVDEIASMSLLFENNVVASLNCGIRAASENSSMLYGTEGKIKVPAFWQSRKATLLDNKNNIIDEIEVEYENGFEYELEHFVKLLKEGKKESDVMPFSATLESCKVYDKLLKR